MLRNRLYSGGAELAANLSGDTAALCPPRHLRGHRLHDLPHRGHPGGPGLGDGRRDERRQLLVRKLGGKVGGQHLALRPFRPPAANASAASRRFFASRASTLTICSSESSCTESPDTSSLVIEVSAIRSVRGRTWSRARIASVRSVRSCSLSSVTETILPHAGRRCPSIRRRPAPTTDCRSLNTGRACRKAWHHG